MGYSTKNTSINIMKSFSQRRVHDFTLPSPGSFQYISTHQLEEMSSYTCISCRVAFADADLQRGHYKTDWHRYNLKRKVAELPPVTAENFQERVLAQRAQVAEEGRTSLVTVKYVT